MSDIICVANSQLCHLSVKAAADSSKMGGCGCVSIIPEKKAGFSLWAGHSPTLLWTKDPRGWFAAKGVSPLPVSEETGSKALLPWHLGSICCHTFIIHSPTEVSARLLRFPRGLGPCTGRSAAFGDDQVRDLFLYKLVLIRCPSKHHTMSGWSPEGLPSGVPYPVQDQPFFVSTRALLFWIEVTKSKAHSFQCVSPVSLYIPSCQEASYLELP